MGRVFKDGQEIIIRLVSVLCLGVLCGRRGVSETKLKHIH